MDVVELSLAADVSVSSLLAAEARVSTTKLAANASVFRSLSAAAACSSSSSGNMKNPVATSNQSSVSRNKDDDADLHMHENLPPSSECDEGSKALSCQDANNPLRMSSKCKVLSITAGKVRSSSPSSKRPRTCQRESSMSLTGNDVDSTMLRKTRCNLSKCTSTEKSRVVKQRHDQDGKRGDKKNFKVPTKTKSDAFMHSTSGGNNILGIYGLKSDIHDVTKHVDELSLSELLDDSFKCPNLSREKGKKIIHTNESLVSSVKKACSILLRHSPLESQNSELDGICSRRKLAGQLISCVTSGDNNDTENDGIKDVASSTKDSCISNALPSLSTLYQPEEILKRLALPPTKDLDTLLRDASVPAVHLQSGDVNCGIQTSHNVGLPPFSWSLSPGGSSRASIDSGKLFMNRNVCHTKWVRLGCNATFLGNATNSFSDLVTDEHHVRIPYKQLNIDDPTENGVPSTTVTLQCHRQDANGSTKHHENEVSPCDSLVHENLNISTEMRQTKGVMFDATDGINCHSPSICTISGYSEYFLHLPPSGSSKQVVMSPRLLAAAQILCELASHSSIVRKQEDNGEKRRWPKKPSPRTMKARKLRSSIGKAEEPSITPKPLTKPDDTPKDTGQIPSSRRKFPSADKRKNQTNIGDIHQGSLKWSVPSISRDSIASTKQWNANPVKLIDLMTSSSAEKPCSSQQRLRKAVVMAPVVTHGKDLGRGRCKKE